MNYIKFTINKITSARTNQAIVYANSFTASDFCPLIYIKRGFPTTNRPVIAAETTNRVNANTGAKNPSGSLKLYFSRIANTHDSHTM